MFYLVLVIRLNPRVNYIQLYSLCFEGWLITKLIKFDCSAYKYYSVEIENGVFVDDCAVDFEI